MDWVRLWGYAGFANMLAAGLLAVLTDESAALIVVLLWLVGVGSCFGASIVLITHRIYERWSKS